MFYAAGEAQDEKEHAKYHAEVTHGIKAQVHKSSCDLQRLQSS